MLRVWHCLRDSDTLWYPLLPYCPTNLLLHHTSPASVSPREMLVVRFPHSSLVALAATYLVLGGSSASIAGGESAGPDAESRSDSQSHSDQDPERNTELLVIAPMTDELARPSRPPIRRVGREVIGGVAYAAVCLGICAPFVDYRPMGYVAGISAVLFLSYAAFAYLSVALGRWQWREEHDRQLRALAVVQRERLARVLDVWGLDGAAACLVVDDLVQGTIRAVAWQTRLGELETKRVGDGYEVVLRPKGVGNGDARRHDALPSGRPDLTKVKVETESSGGGEEGQSPTGQVVLAQVIRDKTAADSPGVWTEKARAVVGEKWAHLLDQYA